MSAVVDTSVVTARDIGPLPGELAISSAPLAELHLGVPADLKGADELVEVVPA